MTSVEIFNFKNGIKEWNSKEFMHFLMEFVEIMAVKFSIPHENWLATASLPLL